MRSCSPFLRQAARTSWSRPSAATRSRRRNPVSISACLWPSPLHRGAGQTDRGDGAPPAQAHRRHLPRLRRHVGPPLTTATRAGMPFLPAVTPMLPRPARIGCVFAYGSNLYQDAVIGDPVRIARAQTRDTPVLRFRSIEQDCLWPRSMMLMGVDLESGLTCFETHPLPMHRARTSPGLRRL